MFIMPAGGSVQFIDQDHILANHPFSGLYILSRKEKKVVKFMRSFHFDKSGLRPPVILKSEDLASFLRNWTL